jgi:hypothetical protein
MAEQRTLFPAGLTRRLTRRLTDYTHVVDQGDCAILGNLV